MHSATAGSLPDRGSMPYLYFICIVSALGGLLFGFDTVVISGTISHVVAKWGLSPEGEGFFVSSALLACIPGAALAGWLSDRFGRRMVLMIAAWLLFISASGCGYAWDFTSLLVFRAIGGVGVGLASLISPLYISELSPPQVRGRMVTLFQFAITIGICLALFSNAALQSYADQSRAALAAAGDTARTVWRTFFIDDPWRAMFAAECVPGIFFIVLCFVIPESPRWLAKMGRTDEALRVLSTIGGATVARREMTEITETISHESAALSSLFKPGLRKALFVAMFLAIVSELSGITVVFYYGPGILEKAGFSLGDALGGFVSIGLVNMFFTLIAIWLMDHLGRRPLLFIGNLGAFVALATIGVLFHQGRQEGGLLVAMMCLFVACFAFSMGPIKWVVMNEIFPTRIRGRAVAIATLSVWVTDTLYNQVYPSVRDWVGEANVFFIFAAVLIPQFFFVLFVMPETKGRTLEQIEQSWLTEKSEAVVVPSADLEKASPN